MELDHSKCVLCVDDEATARTLLYRILKKRYPHVYQARDGEDGLELFKIHRPFIVVSDIEMPRMDGLTMSRHIKDLDPTTKVVLTTAHSEMENLKTAHMVGISDYVVKPVHQDRLNTALDRCEQMYFLERDIKVSQQQVETILESIQDIFFAVDKDWKITYMNHVADQHFKIQHGSLLGQNYLTLYGDTAGTVELLEAMSTQRTQVFELCSDFTGQWFEVRAFPLEEGGISVYMRNIDALKKSEKELLFMAFYDKLTGLPNRASLQRHLNDTIGFCKRHEMKAAVLFMDLDRFKFINDTLGHEVGDLVLIEVGKRLKSCIRSTDMIARFGGDEFVIVLNCLDLENHILQVVQRIFATLSEDITYNTINLSVSTSIGVSMYPTDALTPEDLLKTADVAMFHSKSQGKNAYHFYSPDMNARTEMFLKLETSLRKANYDNAFHLQFQPKVSLKTGALVGFEVLTRWHHHELGWISPLDFIPLAEETGLIIPLGEWIFNTACKQIAFWKTQYNQPLTYAINISGRQFWQGDLLSMVTNATQEYDIDPHTLELEITEGVVVRDVADSRRKMNALVAMGFQLSIDDFGTGYSSLSSLKKFPLSSLKIDKSFVREITKEGGEALCDAIISLGHALDLIVVGEGIETVLQKDYLYEKGCDIGQGYLFGKPLDPSDAEQRFFR